MRKNTERALVAFVNGRNVTPAESVRADGPAIYSYQTCLAVRVTLPHGAQQVTVRNVTRYSPTTTRQQNGLAVSLSGPEVSGLGFGVNGRDVAEAAFPSYKVTGMDFGGNGFALPSLVMDVRGAK